MIRVKLIDEPLGCIDPMRHLAQVIETVDKLNDIAIDRLGDNCASYSGTRWYIAILWHDYLLWDSEGNHRDGMDDVFGEEGGYEPTMEVCTTMLGCYANSLSKVFGEYLTRN